MRWKWIPGPLTVRMAACWLASVAIGWISPAIGRADTPAEDGAETDGGHRCRRTYRLDHEDPAQRLSRSIDLGLPRQNDSFLGCQNRRAVAAVLRPPIDVGLPGKIYTAALSPDGQLLAVAGQSAVCRPGDERVLLISLPGGDMLALCKGTRCRSAD